MRILKSFGVLLAAGLLLAACAKRSPLEDVADAPTDAPLNISLERVTEVIQQAGQARGWQMTETRPGLIRGDLVTGGGKHQVVVDVTYDTKTFSISYVDSRNMNYEENFDGPYIHYRYNRWVRILKEDIQKALSRLT